MGETPRKTNTDPVSSTTRVVCPVEPAVAPKLFRPKPRVPHLLDHMPRASYVHLVGQSLKGWWWNEGDTGASATDFLAFALRLRKTPENLSWKPSGALSSMTSHCFKWGPFTPNEAGRATLPIPLAKFIGSSEKSVLKNFSSGTQRSQYIRSAPPGHETHMGWPRHELRTASF